MATTPRPRRSQTARSGGAGAVRSERIAAAIERTLAGGHAELFELLRGSSGLPGPRANMELARAVGATLASHGGRADRVIVALGEADDAYLRVVAAFALGARSVPGDDLRASRARVEHALRGLQVLAEDARHVVRSGIVEALRDRLAAMGEPAVADLAAWTDGYLHAHIALEALADRTLLTTLATSEGPLARLSEAFVLADGSPRSAERTQGMRALRQGMPAQIAVFAARFPETIAWLEKQTLATRPETREVVLGAIRALRRGVLSDVEAGRLAALLEASAKPRRDADRVVQGTRRRGKGRT
jgi:hypothetical protein